MARRAASPPSWSQSVWIVVSVDESAGHVVVRPAGTAPGEPSEPRTFPLREWSEPTSPSPGAVVRSFVCLQPFAPRWTLSSWLRALHRYAPASSGLTLTGLRAAFRRAHEDDERWLRGTWTAVDLSTVLQLASRAGGKASQAHWLYADDWRWSRERAQRAFERMLELPPDTVPPRPAEHEEPLAAYAERCNAAAKARACERRLHLLGPRGDDHVFVALTASEFDLLVYVGLVQPW